MKSKIRKRFGAALAAPFSSCITVVYDLLVLRYRQ